MRTFNFLGMVLIASMLCFSLNSCGGDDDRKPEEEKTTNGGSETPEENLPEESKKFIGYWVNSAKTTDYYFFREDGYFCHIPVDVCRRGKWTYKQPELTTSRENCQWNIISSDKNSWRGIRYNTNVTETFHRATNFEYQRYLGAFEKWIDENGTIYQSKQDIYYNVFRVLFAEYYQHNSTFDGVYEDDNKDDFVFTYKILKEQFGETIGSGTLTIINPYHPTECQIIFTGSIEKTLTICPRE